MSAKSSHPKPSEAALQRLDQAISRLEQAIVTAPPAPRSDLFGADELTHAKQDYVKLDQASRQVEMRLDQMADRLQALLEP